MKFILASASPRRKKLLEDIGLTVQVIPSQAEEEMDRTLPPAVLVQNLAMLKGAEVAKRVLQKEKDAIVISADTVVTKNDEILGKPTGRQQAFSMLKLLEGETHEVYTGICLIHTGTGRTAAEHEVSRVQFRPLNDEEINRYLDTGEYKDKAGAYGIQGKGALLTERVEGDYFNIVGLPLSRLNRMLEKEFSITILR